MLICSLSFWSISWCALGHTPDCSYQCWAWEETALIPLVLFSLGKIGRGTGNFWEVTGSCVCCQINSSFPSLFVSCPGAAGASCRLVWFWKQWLLWWDTFWTVCVGCLVCQGRWTFRLDLLATEHFLYYIVLYFGVVKPVLWLSALEMLPGSVLFTSASVPWFFSDLRNPVFPFSESVCV